MKQAPWILCCLLFTVILLQRACPSKLQGTVPQSEYDAMAKAVVDTANYYQEIIKADDAAIDLATVKAEESDQRARESEDKLTASQADNARLIAKINAGRKEKPDGTFIPVSPKYIDGCDSLTLISGAQDLLINKYKKDNAILRISNEQQVAAMNKKLQDQANLNSAMKNQLANCLTKFKEKDSVKVKNQWFGEIGLMGNPVQPIGGGEIGLTLINKKGVMYGLKAQLSGGQLWYGVKTGFKLFK